MANTFDFINAGYAVIEPENNENKLINFLKEYPSNIVVKVQNYYFKFFDSAYVLFADSFDLSQKEMVFSLGQYKVAITKVFFSQLFFLIFVFTENSIKFKDNL